ncbi:MAG: urease accessory protein UreF [Deltaproteobacteria bacterium]|nr:urease accessory protein UreF [Deltaproteobacteria bacterium]
MPSISADPSALFRLLGWLSPGFPVGAFAYSHGLEAAFERGDVSDRGSLVEWLEGLLRFGSARCDAGLAACAHRAVCDDDDAALCAVADFAAALFGAPELARESFQQGDAFWKTIATSWPHPRLAAIAGSLPSGRLAYPVAVGAAAAAHGVPRDATCLAYLHAFVANGVSSAIRLGMLGQTDGQHVLRACEGTVVAAAESACSAELASLGSASLALDLFALAHETQTTRLFRS